MHVALREETVFHFHFGHQDHRNLGKWTSQTAENLKTKHLKTTTEIDVIETVTKPQVG